MAHQAELERAVPPELRRIAVDQTDARLLRDRWRLAVSEAEVERGAEDQHEIRMGQRPAAGMGERRGVAHRECPPPGAVHEDGDAGGVGEGRQRLSGVVPVDAAAREHDRPLGAGDERGESGDVGRVGQPGRTMHVARRDRGEPILDRLEQEIHGNLHEHRPRASGESGPDRGRQDLGDPARLRHRPRALRDRAEQRHLLDVLEGAAAAEGLRRRAADQEQRTAGARGVGDARHGVGDARAGRHHRDADAACQPRVGVAGVGSRLLVPHVDDADALGQATVVDRQDMTAAEREDVPHACLPEDLRDELPAGQLRHRPGLLRPAPAQAVRLKCGRMSAAMASICGPVWPGSPIGLRMK